MGGCLGPRDPFFKWPKFMAYKGWGDPNYLLTGMILQVVGFPSPLHVTKTRQSDPGNKSWGCAFLQKPGEKLLLRRDFFRTCTSNSFYHSYGWCLNPIKGGNFGTPNSHPCHTQKGWIFPKSSGPNFHIDLNHIETRLRNTIPNVNNICRHVMHN